MDVAISIWAQTPPPPGAVQIATETETSIWALLKTARCPPEWATFQTPGGNRLPKPTTGNGCSEALFCVYAINVVCLCCKLCSMLLFLSLKVHIINLKFAQTIPRCGCYNHYPDMATEDHSTARFWQVNVTFSYRLPLSTEALTEDLICPFPPQSVSLVLLVEVFCTLHLIESFQVVSCYVSESLFPPLAPEAQGY